MIGGTGSRRVVIVEVIMEGSFDGGGMAGRGARGGGGRGGFGVDGRGTEREQKGNEGRGPRTGDADGDVIVGA